MSLGLLGLGLMVFGIATIIMDNTPQDTTKEKQEDRKWYEYEDISSFDAQFYLNHDEMTIEIWRTLTLRQKEVVWKYMTENNRGRLAYYGIHGPEDY